MKAWRLNNMKVAARIKEEQHITKIYRKFNIADSVIEAHEAKIEALQNERIPHRSSRQNTVTQAVPSDLLLMLFANVKLPVPEAWREAMIAASAETQTT